MTQATLHTCRIACAVLLVLATAAPTAQAQVDATLRRLLVTDDAEAWRDGTDYLAYEPVSAYGAAEVALLGRVLARPRVVYFPDLIRVAGAVGPAGILDSLPAGALDDEATRQVVEHARIRQGDLARAKDLVTRLREMPLSDAYVRRLVPQLLYTRARPVIDYLYQLASVEQAYCQSPDPETTTFIDCGYRLAEQLGRVTVGFPVPLDFEGLLDVDDYPAALQRVRRWYAAHADSYVIDETEIL